MALENWKFIGYFPIKTTPTPLTLVLLGGKEIVIYNKRWGRGVWRIVSYNFFGPKKLGETGSQNVTIDVGHGNLHFSHPSPQLLHLLARFGKGIPEGDSLHVFLQAFGNLPCGYLGQKVP